ncbi:hypothetical protein ACFPM7_15310 [Actinokineospora guangxiensis]|uniref:Acyl-protein synthetase LuxE domain-containing protein n=1 Tax=Actinokineospora guangxiensis TaxID=1490288 RepID=A0ABW0ELX1_9PSEU
MSLASLLGSFAATSRAPETQWQVTVAEVIADAFATHFRDNEFFRAQCDAIGLTPQNLERTRSGLVKIPLLPVKMFKQPDAHVLLSVPLNDIELEIRSTGTGGVPSVARRDAATVTNTALAILGQYRDLFSISKGAGLFLCPSTAETPEMGMVKVFNLLNGLFDDHTYLVKDYAFDPQEALDYLERWDGSMTRYIVGPPFLVNRLLRFLELEDIRLKLDPESMVITLGGWKRYTGESMSREDFNAKIEEYLGIGTDRVRDMYGLIETNMLAIECAEHRKHVPPWCHVSIRDVTDPYLELPAGRTGTIGILDALSGGYPGFILTEDIGEVDETPCPCGRTGQTVTFHRRAHGAELGCCAVSIEKFIESQEVVAECAVPGAEAGR